MWYDLVIFLMVSVGLARIIADEVVAEDLREFMRENGLTQILHLQPFFLGLLRCSKCVAFWTGCVASIVIKPITFDLSNKIVDNFAVILPCGVMAYFAASILSKLIDEEDHDEDETIEIPRQGWAEAAEEMVTEQEIKPNSTEIDLCMNDFSTLIIENIKELGECSPEMAEVRRAYAQEQRLKLVDVINFLETKEGAECCELVFGAKLNIIKPNYLGLISKEVDPDYEEPLCATYRFKTSVTLPSGKILNTYF